MSRIRRLLSGSADRIAGISRPVDRTLRISLVIGGMVRRADGFGRRVDMAFERAASWVGRKIPQPVHETIDETGLWIRETSPWYAASMLTHMALFAVVLFAFGWLSPIRVERPRGEKVVSFDAAEFDPSPPPGQVDLPDGVSYDPSELDASTLVQPSLRTDPEQHVDNSSTFVAAGGGRKDLAGADGFGMGGFDVRAAGPGPKVYGKGGIGAGRGNTDHAGSGGASDGFRGRGKGNHPKGDGHTIETERAVAAALLWFNRHRNANGSWSLTHFTAHCGANPCTGAGSTDSDVAATSLALLTFLAAGETHKQNGPYQTTVQQGLYWLMKQQAAGGDMSGAGGRRMSLSRHQMYDHALATITLCEAYGMTHDPAVGKAAQRAIEFIEWAQVQRTGGWRYVPQDPTGGDTSVFGWQLMALHSAQLAGLTVHQQTLEGGKRWLASVSKGFYGGQFAYQPFKDPTPTMTAIGLLSMQYLGRRADDPAVLEGRKELLANLPDNGKRNTYYWYYATQAMHNFMGPDWDTWNRQMRRTLLDTQCKQGCAMGSWDPENPTLDEWSAFGGRIVTTAFSTLTLEVYYRYLPLYQSGVSPSDKPLPDAAPSPLSGATAGPLTRPAL